MKPFLTKGYAKRKLHTGNQSVQFDEEVEVERPLLYSTIGVMPTVMHRHVSRVAPLPRRDSGRSSAVKYLQSFRGCIVIAKAPGYL